MRTRLGEEPAFPGVDGDEGRGNMTGREGPNGYIWTRVNQGMTNRVYLAGLAMQGLLADHKDHSDECADGETCPQTVARLAVEHADALLVELEKTRA